MTLRIYQISLNCIYLYLITALKSISRFSRLAGALSWVDTFVPILQQLVLITNIV